MNMPANERRLPDNERSIAVSMKFRPGVRCLIPTFLSVFRIPVLWRRISVYICCGAPICAVIPDYFLGGTSYIPLQAVLIEVHSFRTYYIRIA